MEKLEKLYEGKAKQLYATDDPEVLWVEYKNTATAGAAYTPGVYTSSITLGGNAVDVAVTVSETRIESIAFNNLSEAVETMYPLMQPALDNLADQICETQSLDGLDYSEEAQYTSQVILGAVERALEKAAAPQAEEAN